MPHIDPVVRFWIGIAVTVAIAVSGGTLTLTHVVPQDWIPIVTAWCSIIAFVGSAVLTTLNGLGTTAGSRLASASAIPEVTKIVTTSPAMADEAGPKVVSP